MKTTKLYAIWNDPVALNEYILDQNADRIASGQGWSSEGYSRFLGHCRRLAALLGEDTDTVVNQIIAEARS